MDGPERAKPWARTSPIRSPDSAARASKPPPARTAATEDARVARGREVFGSRETGCADCHSPNAAFTDGDRHDVSGEKLDTPSLRGVAGSAPYFHDGRFQTLRELLEKSDGQMGHTKHLSASDREALEVYLRTL